MSQPLVSIITPSFNQGRYIAQTIRSVQEQTYPNIEHIVVDGASTDGTLDVLENAARHGRLRYISEPDDGMYAAVNKGLRLATGDIYAYLNSDDLYLPWSVEVAVARFIRRPHVGFVFGDVVNFDDATLLGRLVITPWFRQGFLVRHGFLTQPTVFWRRGLTESHGMFDDTLQFIADCDYWMRIGSAGEGSRISEVLALERNHVAAKRFAHSSALEAELALVRRRHHTAGTPFYRASDKHYEYFARGWFTALSLLRTIGVLPRTRGAYRRGFGAMQPSSLRLLLTLIPYLRRTSTWNVKVPWESAGASEAGPRGSRDPLASDR